MPKVNLFSDQTSPLVFDLKKRAVCTLAYYSSDDLESINTIEQGASKHPWSKKNIEDSLSSSHHCLGVYCEGRWIAHAVISLAADEAELLILSVDTLWQGQGVAKSFLSLLFPLLSLRARELFLEVRESNEVAINLYDSLGFNLMGVRTNYYPTKRGREDALIYGLRLVDDERL